MHWRLGGPSQVTKSSQFNVVSTAGGMSQLPNMASLLINETEKPLRDLEVDITNPAQFLNLAITIDGNLTLSLIHI